MDEKEFEGLSQEQETRYISDWDKQFILERDGYHCRYCGEVDSPFHIDHVYPFSFGGITDTRNLVTSCSMCNRKKSSKIGIWPKPIGYFDKNYAAKLPHSVLGNFTLFCGFIFCFFGMDILLNTSYFLSPRIFLVFGVCFIAYYIFKLAEEN